VWVSKGARAEGDLVGLRLAPVAPLNPVPFPHQAGKRGMCHRARVRGRDQGQPAGRAARRKGSPSPQSQAAGALPSPDRGSSLGRERGARARGKGLAHHGVWARLAQAHTRALAHRRNWPASQRARGRRERRAAPPRGATPDSPGSLALPPPDIASKPPPHAPNPHTDPVTQPPSRHARRVASHTAVPKQRAGGAGRGADGRHRARACGQRRRRAISGQAAGVSPPSRRSRASASP